MARRPREFAAGVYHTSAHGSSHRELFLDDFDRHAFLDLLSVTWAKLGLELISYVLMTNHYHAVTWIPDLRLSMALKILHGRYSFHQNKRHRDSAHLFRAHCFARRVRNDDDLLATEHYVAHNPSRQASSCTRSTARGVAREPTQDSTSPPSCSPTSGCAAPLASEAIGASATPPSSDPRSKKARLNG